MLFKKVVGNIDEIENIQDYHIERIFLSSDDMLKRILRVISDHKREYGISLEDNEKLKDGDILYNKDKKLIVIKSESDDCIVITPKDVTQMGKIAHSLGNRHLPAQFEDGKMIIQYDRLVEEELKNQNINYCRKNIKLKKAFRHVKFAHTH